MENIRENKKNWSFGDNLGVAYHFSGNRLFKFLLVLNSSGIRARNEIRNQEIFFGKLIFTLLNYPFVKVCFFLLKKNLI